MCRRARTPNRSIGPWRSRAPQPEVDTTLHDSRTEANMNFERLCGRNRFQRAHDHGARRAPEHLGALRPPPSVRGGRRLNRRRRRLWRRRGRFGHRSDSGGWHLAERDDIDF